MHQVGGGVFQTPPRSPPKGALRGEVDRVPALHTPQQLPFGNPIGNRPPLLVSPPFWLRFEGALKTYKTDRDATYRVGVLHRVVGVLHTYTHTG